ncbi:MAG: MBL fold metallo-hydrolase [Anaerolineales bacterium]|nr:MAG: MBL fold metallo-hydrolase [Anaerolineales bacterium]
MGAMTIRFLGTSARFPLPRWGCECPQCSDAQSNPQGVRSRPSILVNRRVLIDPGPDVYAQLAALPPDEVRAIRDVVITHPHPEHHLGLDDLSQFRHVWNLDQLPVWAQFDSWTLILVTFNYLVSHELDPGQGVPRPFSRSDMTLGEPFELGEGLTFTPFDTFHTSTFATAGLVIEQDDLRVVYAPDFYDSAFFGLAEPDLLILDGTFAAAEQVADAPDLYEGHGRHLPIEDGVRFAQAIRARRTLFTHIGHFQITPEELHAYLPDETFDVAYDGQVVELLA